VHMDLEPFSRINPCGLTDTEVTQIADLGGPADLDRVRGDLMATLAGTYRISLRKPDSSDPSAA